MAERPELVLIDGHALAYRRYFALKNIGKPMTSPRGKPTGAVYGFTQALISILKEKPEYIAVSFDKGLSGREAVFEDYKQNRDDMPDDLAAQFDDIEAMVRAFNIPVLALDGYEADDVIGTIAKQAEEQGCQVRIITGDRDLLQLLNEHTIVQIPGKKGEEDKIWTLGNFGEGYEGLRASQLIEYKGLKGDSSDNIPGVLGIGDKTATRLLLQFGTLEGVYENLDKLGLKDRAKLEAGRQLAFLSRDLATIKRDVPIQLDLSACHARDFDPKQVIVLFNEFGFGDRTHANFTGLLNDNQLAELEAFRRKIAGQPFFVPEYTVVLIQSQLEALAEKLNRAEKIAFDTETTSLDKMQSALVGISLAVDGTHGYYIPVGHRSPNEQPSLFGDNEDPQQLSLQTVVEALRPALTNPAIPKIAHNGLYDLIILRRYGIDVAPITEDTMVKAWVIDPSQNIGLKELAAVLLHIRMQPIDELIGSGKNQISMARVPIDNAAGYAAADAVATFQLLEPLNQKIEPQMQALYETFEIPLIPVLADMEMAGIRVNVPYLNELSKELAERLKGYESIIHELAEEKFNVNSLQQLNTILFDKLKLPTDGLRKTTTGFSLDAATLDDLADRVDHPILREILAYRSLAKLLNTYVDALPELVNPETKRVHTSFNQTGTVTGRVSSNNPNLQNIPIRTDEGRRVRKAFIADDGHVLLSVDYSQIELRILAHYSGDQTLTQAFLEGQDIHRMTAAKVYNIPPEDVTYNQRRFAKSVNFGLMYGMGAFRLARDSELTFSEAQKFIEAYFDNFPGIRDYFQQTEAFVKEKGYVQTLFGRRRYFDVQTRGSGEKHISDRNRREAINMPIQGTSADIMKKAMIALNNHLKAEGHRARILLQVHDELVLEVPEDEVEIIRRVAVEELVKAGNVLDVPVVADARVGKNWDEMS